MPLQRPVLLMLTLAIGMAAGPALAEDARPNFVLILADDLGYADVGFTGATDIETPRLDALAEGGVVFQNGYVTHPYCGPSRAGLITGRYQARFGVEINFTYSPYDRHSGLPVEEKTFADRLRAAGYRTGVIGKWHLGAAPPFHPNNRGFDYFYGFLSGGHDYFPDTVDTRHSLTHDNGRIHYSANEGCLLPLTRNHDAAEFDEYLTTALSRDAARFVRESEGPFCLYLAYNAPHGPLQAPRELIDKYAHIDNRRRRVYAAMIDAMDSGVGMVVDALEETGQLDNTLVFFLSDNGGVVDREGVESGGYASNAPYRSGKGGLLEGGSHVPFLAHWPDGLPRGASYDAPVSALDIAATFVELGEGDRSGAPLEGVNLVPYVRGERDDPPHDALYWRIRDGRHWAVRTPTAKFVLPNPFEIPGEPTGPKLYDLSADPYESTNLAAERPELRAKLAALWNRWNAGNQPNRFLQANEYQAKRFAMYAELRAEQDAAAASREPVVIE